MQTQPIVENSSVREGMSHSIEWPITILALNLALLWFILCRHLSNEWSANEQYSYGWFVPFFAAYLFWLRWQDRPGRGRSLKARAENPNSDFQSLTPTFLIAASYFLLLAALLPLRLFEIGNPDWRPLGWAHATIVVTLTLTLIWHFGGLSWLRHFALPVCFILVAVPWVSPIETPIVQGLMHLVAAIACEAVNLLGIPAQLEGSVIRVASGVVGVNEACSGVRSLQTSIMIGLLFGELQRLSLGRRFTLLAGAIVLAFVANCTRAFFLVWIAARRNIDAVARWHDLAGYAILAAVFLGTILLARALENREEKGGSAALKSRVQTSRHRLPDSRYCSSAFLLSTFCWLLLVEASSWGWYRAHEVNLVSAPGWKVRWPEERPGFRELKISEDVRSTLRYDFGREASWPLVSAGGGEPVTGNTLGRASMFFFRWEPGATSILRARSHRPDICLPNTGWELTNDNGVSQYPLSDGSSVPFRHFTFARPRLENRPGQAHAFFCESEDRLPRDEVNRFSTTAGTTSNWMRSDRVRVVWQGLRNQGQQVLEVVILTPRPIDSSTAEAEFANLVPQIIY